MEKTNNLMNEAGKQDALNRVRDRLKEAGASLVIGDEDNASIALKEGFASMVECFIHDGMPVGNFMLRFFCEARGLEFEEIRPLVKRDIPFPRDPLLHREKSIGRIDGNLAYGIWLDDVK